MLIAIVSSARRRLVLSAWLVAAATIACSPATEYDLVIRHGTLYDGTGAPGTVQDVAINGDRIIAAATWRQRRDARKWTPRVSRWRRGSSTC
jgi:N-acyl-D-amino-acid deacylase